MNGELPNLKNLEQKVFSINNEETFTAIALEIFKKQAADNPVYRKFCETLGRTADTVHAIHDIPFLPISFFKTEKIITGGAEPEVVFESSGTTSTNTSMHFVASKALYKKSFEAGFKQAFGAIDQYCILGLLPSYLERSGSSLVFMVDSLIQSSNHPMSGFYLHNLDSLHQTLLQLEGQGQKIILFGVSFALLDFAKEHPTALKNTIIIETGGMKGRRKELTREELQSILKESFGLPAIHSEYGMTELLSQAYGKDGIYICPPWMKVLVRDETDPLTTFMPGQNNTGAINVIDLANLYSCSFIATGDAGKVYKDGRFEILGRLDNTDIRGCSLLAM